MTDALVEKVARAIDPEVWVIPLPVPMNVDAFNARRRRARELAQRALAALSEDERWRAGYEAAREQAAGIADGEDMGRSGDDYDDGGSRVARSIAAAIRAMEPKP